MMHIHDAGSFCDGRTDRQAYSYCVVLKQSNLKEQGFCGNTAFRLDTHINDTLPPKASHGTSVIDYVELCGITYWRRWGVILGDAEEKFAYSWS